MNSRRLMTALRGSRLIIVPAKTGALEGVFTSAHVRFGSIADIGPDSIE
jgi:hypothetical protein